MSHAAGPAADGAISRAALRERLVALGTQIAELDPNHWYRGYLPSHADRMTSDIELMMKSVPRGGRVLDIGCSPPFVLATLQSLGYDAIGVDVQPAVFANSKSVLGLNAVACNIEQEPLPFPDESFDAVLMCEVFEHLRINPVRTMHEVRRLLRPGGLLHLTTPNFFSLGGLKSMLVERKSYFYTRRDLYDELDQINIEGFSGHVREYTYREVEGFLVRVGFARVDCHFRFGGTKLWTRPVYRLAPFLRPNVAVQAFR
jgi:SAM-dependent methyltransferase